jgi:hypothetical protein
MAHTKLLFRSVGFKQTFIDNKLMGKLVWGLGSRTRHPYFYNTEILFRRNRYSIHVISRRRRPATPRTTNNTVPSRRKGRFFIHLERKRPRPVL